MARVATAAALIASAVAQDLQSDPSTARDMLFSNPGAELPDVYLSESVVFVSESTVAGSGAATGANSGADANRAEYSVVLTHPPGMREDETIDLDNDEVRIYLTSSQEVFQQDDSCTNGVGCVVQFEQRRNHRTQLIITTNDVDNDLGLDKKTLAEAVETFANGESKVWGQDGADVSDAGVESSAGIQTTADFSAGSDVNLEMPLGPLPYIYKTYSTVGGNVPTQQSPVDGTEVLVSVCPVCTHPAYCVLYDGTDHSSNGEDTLVNIPAQSCETDANSDSGGCAAVGGGAREATTLAELTAATPGAPFLAALTGLERIVEGSTVTSAQLTDMDATQYPAGTPSFLGCWQVKLAYAPVMDMCAENPDIVVSDLNPLKGRCMKTQSTFTVYNGLLPRQAGGTHPLAAGWSYESPVPMVHTIPGNSDFRIDEIGDQVLRTRSDPRSLCRYSNCPELTVNGGDRKSVV